MTRNNPVCLFCTTAQTRPCAPDGSFDASWLALSYLEMIDAGETDKKRHEALFWTYACLSDIENNDPETAFHITLLMIDALTSAHQASLVAAGPLEELIAKHGETYIDRIEALAKSSKRFQYVLSGVWSHGQDDSAVWKRVSKLQEDGPHMDRGDDLPASDMRL